MSIITRYFYYNQALWMFRQSNEKGSLGCTLKRFSSQPNTDFPVSEIFFDASCLLTRSKVEDYCDANKHRGNEITLHYPTTQDLLELLLNLNTQGKVITPLSGGWSNW